MKRFFLSIALMASVFMAQAQSKAYRIHSHNDYQQSTPFWTAYSNGAQSIEVDLVLDQGALYVAHELHSVDKNRTIESLYLEPLSKALTLNIGKAKGLHFLIDLKSNANQSMKLLLPVLQKYEKLIKEQDITFVISGNKPDAKEFSNYPSYIQIDHQSLTPLTDQKLWDRVAMVSLNFRDYSVWNGKGRIVEEEKQKLQEVIDLVHNQGKTIRFWGTPDGKTAFKAFVDMGIDVINTDNPYLANTYLSNLHKTVYTNQEVSKVYKPTFANDDKNMPIKNVILLVGDGNGLTQISSAALANGGDLSLLQLKSIGFLKTQSGDDFTTDSAAGGTALATGEKTYNRSIGMSMERKPLVNITEYLTPYKFKTGVISTDELTGATPSSFYAHQKDRDDDTLIAKDLLTSNLSLFVGAGKKSFKGLDLNKQFSIVETVNEVGVSKAKRVGMFLAEGGLKGVIDGRTDVLAQATKNSLEFLSKDNQPFFLMVEGAKIDSYGHFNNTGGIITEGIDFDRAITEALKFADKDGQTLVIVTADHETAGFAIPQGDVKKGIIEGDFISNDHTGTMIPIFAYGPRSGEFRGVYENNEVYHKIIKLLNLKKK
ncbi:alkaline phosphatase [Myroides marinus]|uniref:alkaline phosphatase n=1 Tax=Myroides marinus TaxID=703342 RepID=UPI002578BCA9|nr:alkaline phosphatase [Myroides marinus]